MIVTRIFAAGDGTRHRFGPGDVLFVEGTTGEGHITRTLEGMRGFAHVPVPPEFDITRWPLAAAAARMSKG